MRIEIRKLETMEEMRLVQSIEREVWGMDPIPTHQTFTASKNGGVLVGAFDKEGNSGEGKIVGFCYGFPGFKDGNVFLCSHMMGIHQDYRSVGIGRMLKEEQRRIAKEIGYERIVWTFDPLESRNTYLNTTKLFGISDTYIVNCYGEMKDGLNKGLPSDRLQIEWWINSERVEKHWSPNHITFKNPFEINKSPHGNPVLLDSGGSLPIGEEGIEVPIPIDIQSIKINEPDLALDWRMKIREIYQSLFSAGFVLVGLRKAEETVHYAQFIQRRTIPLQPLERGIMQ